VPSLLIMGSQWGDEGKGKIVDIISQQADVVARYQGGSNAGHTVVNDGKQYILHLVPSGILHPNCECVIGNGVVVDPDGLTKEIADLEALGFDVRHRLFLSDCAHLVLPYHKLLDAAQEQLRGKGKIGTTGRGIGCAYGDRATRIGLRVGDLRREKIVREKIARIAEFYEPLFEKVYEMEVPNSTEVAEWLLEAAEILSPLQIDCAAFVNERLDRGENVLIEGAQGILLDIDHGTYPFVTSSNPSPGGACTGLGVGPHRIGRIAGVAKAYTTRVGEGPMPSEFEPEFAERIRREGGEYGATTGRPRRCGWFDAPAVRRSMLVSNLDEIMLTKLDVLDPLDTIKIATHYRMEGKEVSVFPYNLAVEDEVEAIYEELPGWKTPTSGCRRYEDLPENAQRYVERIEQILDVPISVVSVSAERNGTIIRRPDFFSAS